MKKGLDRPSGKQVRSGDKRRFCRLCLICLLVVMLCGCQKATPQGNLQNAPAEQLDIGLSFGGGRWENDCRYADDAVMLLAIDHDLEKNVGSMRRTVNTVAFVLYDLQAMKVKQVFPVDLEIPFSG